MVNPFPLIVTTILIIAPVLSFILAFYYNKKVFIVTTCVSVFLYLIVPFVFFAKGWLLKFNAGPNNPEAQYQYARWKENHCSKINNLIIFPCSPDVEGGFKALKKAAKWDYPKAVWLVGVRYKYGISVPKPENWTDIVGGKYPQPERGQKYVDRAVNELGFDPPPPDYDVSYPDGVYYYWHRYRNNDLFDCLDW